MAVLKAEKFKDDKEKELVLSYIGKHTPYEALDVLDRVENSRPVSEGMLRAIKEAKEYAGKKNAGNSNARKRDENLDTTVKARVTKEEKAAFFKAAGGKKLSTWIVETLKKEAGI